MSYNKDIMETRGLTLTNLSFYRGNVPILKCFSVHLESGNSLIVHGKNGSGKSTLLKLMAGLLKPHEGTLQGPKDLAYMGHATGLPHDLSVYDYITLMKADAEPLKAWGLAPMMLQPIAKLSQGQKKRLRLALMPQRSLWILDEPFAGLDENGKNLAADLINNHLKQGGMAVIATHETMGIHKAQSISLGEQSCSKP